MVIRDYFFDRASLVVVPFLGVLYAVREEESERNIPNKDDTAS